MVEIKRLENSLKDKQAKSAIESIKKEPKEKIDHKAKRAELRTKLKDAVEPSAPLITSFQIIFGIVLLTPLKL